MAATGQQVPPFPAPQDQELKNIIDKLANFVARNGTKFEEMTKTKQKDNPKFSFLFGGDYFNYYKWRVSVEIAQGKLVPQHLQSQGQSFPNSQASLVQQAIVQQSIQSAPWQQPPQVQPSQASTGQPQGNQQSYQLSSESINISEFEGFLAKIMQSCTKENISNGKNWIFKHCKTDEHFKQVADYMLLRVTGAGMGFLHKLHIIYLINDVLHNASRKTTLNVKSQLQQVIIPIYCHTFVGESQENQQRCEKVVRIWETNSYFDGDIIQKLKNPVQTKEELQSSEAADQAVTQKAEQPTESTESTKQEGENTPDVSGKEENTKIPATTDVESSAEKQAIPTLQPPPPHSENLPFPPHPPSDPMFPPDPNFPFPPPNFHQFPPPGFPRPPFNQPPPGFNGHPMPPFDPNFPGPPPMFPPIPPQQFDYNHGFSDQAPPGAVHDYHHGQGGAPPVNEERPPQAMYYELPAGLMVPLINSPDVDYKPLSQDDIKLPPPQPPSERLIAAVEAFYSPPSHERPRNSEGWEAGALHEFYKTKLKFIKEREVREKVEKVKEMAKKHLQPKQDETEEERRSRSRSKSPEKTKSPSPKRRSRSRSPARRRSRSRTKSKSRSRSPRRRRSRSLSLSRSRSKSRSRSGSRSRSRSRSPRRRRSRSPVPRQRSPTPPSFAGAYLQQSLNTRIDETNVGHQLLKKMGWEGAGLGKSEQGIQDPIKQGEVRDKQDMFKGIGVNINDPFDKYRKNMSYTYNRPRRDRDRR